jgi:CRISPR-associated protein Csm1
MNRETIYLAGLLHDIGKFWQRADPNGGARSEVLTSATLGNESQYCPVYQGKYSHKHVLWTAQFIDNHKAFFQDVVGNADFEAFFNAAVKHHAPDQGNVDQWLVQQADHLSSGVDRQGEKGQQDGAAEGAWDSFKNVRLKSVFGSLMGHTGAGFELPIRALDDSDQHFPKTEKTAKGQPEYAELWNAFASDFEALKKQRNTLKSVQENLYYLLYKYTIAVPSSTMHLPDVSLFDHLKSVGIMSICLHDYLSAHGRLTAGCKLDSNDAPFLLLGGDLSGIQTFIYDIVSKSAAKNLKGRSFYLQMMVETVVDLILEQLQLPLSAVVYASGGGFYLLAPNTPDAIGKIQAVRNKVTHAIFEKHKTELSLQLDWTEVTVSQIYDQRINEIWDELGKKLGIAKSQRFKSLLTSQFDAFFEPQEVLANDGKRIIFEDALIELGRELKEADGWVTSSQSSGRRSSIPDIGLSRRNALYPNDIDKNVPSPDRVHIKSFSVDKVDWKGADRGNGVISGFTFYAGNDYPTDEQSKLIFFDELADSGGAFSRLGVLRMDVDNLGQIFKNGFSDRSRTFSRYSGLSRSLDYFFKSYLNTIWRTEGFTDHKGEKIPFNETINIIYSGGDDLFIVGYWESTIAFAKKIKEAFKHWTCKNPHLSISGGVVLVGGKFPVAKSAEMAGEAEKLAKNHTIDQEGKRDKNAITLFGRALNWDTELPMVEKMKKEMLDLYEAKQLNRGVFQKFQAYAGLAAAQEKAIKDNGHGSHQWRWHMAYDFKRAQQRSPVPETVRFFEKIQLAVIAEQWDGKPLSESTNYSFLELLEVAARWAELCTKSES